MFRTFLIMGGALDLLIALLLVIVFGWILDSWHDAPVPWAGPIMTSLWLIAFVLSAGAPILGYYLSRRKAPPGRIVLAAWLPAGLLIAVCVVGLIISPP
jgi:hypothetical protein